MNEFFDLLDNNMFARIFIVAEVWVSAILGYAAGYYSKNKKK